LVRTEIAKQRFYRHTLSDLPLRLRTRILHGLGPIDDDLRDAILDRAQTESADVEAVKLSLSEHFVGIAPHHWRFREFT